MTISRRATKTSVLLDGKAVDFLHPLTVELNVGGGMLNAATFESMVMPTGEPTIAGVPLIGFKQATCEILITTYSGNVWPIHYGQVVRADLEISEQGQVARFVSRMQNFHFGVPLAGMRMQVEGLNNKPKTAVPVELEPPSAEPKRKKKAPRQTALFPDEPVFNPQHEGRLVPNLALSGTKGKKGGGAGNSTKPTEVFFVDAHQLLLAELSLPITGKEKEQDTVMKTADGINVGFWTLPVAVAWLCYECNFDQTHIRNPTLLELRQVLPSDTQILRNHKQPLGAYLPEQLDVLLNPYGFSWHVDFQATGKRKIRVFARGGGEPGNIMLQGADEELDMNKSNAEDISLNADLADKLVNEVRVLGDRGMIEATFELVPGWLPKYDELRQEDGEDSDPFHLNDEGWVEDPGRSRGWRDWVLNEAGDYNNDRPFIKKAYDLSKVLGPYVPRRRKFEPTITLGTDGNPIGQSGGMTLEWWDSHQSLWLPVSFLSAEGATVQILALECGIRFSGQLPPSEIRDQGIADEDGRPNAKVRVTATIESDRRLEWLLSQVKRSALNKPSRATLDCASRFKFRAIHSTSIYYKDVQAKKLRSSQRNDIAAAALVASTMLGNFNQASLSGNVKLTGCGWAPTGLIGRAVGKVGGREIALTTTHPQQPKRYSTVVGMHYDFKDQSIGLVFDTYRHTNF